jgi:transitional endoplasmic reticulum ATPase
MLGYLMNAQSEPMSATGAGPVAPIMGSTLQLTPSQILINKQLEIVLKVAPIVALLGTAGLGKSLLLRRQAERHGGRVITLREMSEAAANAHPLAFQDAFVGVLKQAVDDNGFVAVDDLNYVVNIATSLSAPRGGYTPMVLKQLLEFIAEDPRKRLLVAGSPLNQYGWFFLDVLLERAAVVNMAPFAQEDYAVILGNILPGRSQHIDFQVAHRYASRLQGHQLRLIGELLQEDPAPTTERFIETTNKHVLISNVSTREVEDITFDLLPGAEHIAEVLENNIILPLENRKLARDMDLKPKRGVLLYGPPGTGKTVIGRALAHRMKGKFFMIDGSFISEPPGSFFSKLLDIVADAKANAPSVLFIDDADVLFKIEHIQGVVRFLLSLLDGLESETASNVCVMMTAMDVRQIPDAVLRSGRVEVWLRTDYPDEELRARILERYLGKEKNLPDAERIDFAAVAQATEGFTQADLRRLAGDAKSLYASDVVHKRRSVTGGEYLRRAVQAIIEVRGRMAESLGDEKLRLDNNLKSKYFNGPAANYCGETCGY